MPEDRIPCRDFERGVCNRGADCKYYHPEGAAPAESGKLPICKDFQNKGCDRYKCKFLHVTVDEEAIYNSTGKLPTHGGKPENISSLSNNKDICRDFLKGRCDRGNRCRFSHASELEADHHSLVGSAYGKRPRREDYLYGPPHGGGGDPALLEENDLLKRKVDDLQREITNLRQMNDTLYEQNTKYRSQLSTSVVYPQVSQSAYSLPAAALPTSSAAGAGAYSYHY